MELAGIPAYVEPSFLFLLLIYFAFGAQNGRLDFPRIGLFCFAVFISLLVHEYGHAFMARARGCDGIRIALWAGGGLAYHRPTTRGNSLLVIGAGPGLQLIFGLVSRYLYQSNWFEAWQLADPIYYFLHGLVWINFSWVALNLIPIYPLDGGQFLYHLLTYRWDDRRALLFVARFSMPLCVVVGLLGLHYQFTLLTMMCVNFFMSNLQIAQSNA